MALDFQLAEEHTMVRTTVRSMLSKYEPRRKELIDMAKAHIFPEELWQDFAKVGLLGCLVPEEYGGNNMGLLPLTLAFEEITASGFSPGLLLVTAMDSACILKNGSEEPKRRVLPPGAGGAPPP